MTAILVRLPNWVGDAAMSLWHWHHGSGTPRPEVPQIPTIGARCGGGIKIAQGIGAREVARCNSPPEPFHCLIIVTYLRMSPTRRRGST